VKKKVLGPVLATFAVVLILGTIGGGLALWKYKAGSNAPAWEPAEAVLVVAARSTRWTPTAELSGTVVALQSITLGSEVSGTVKDVMFDSGAIVEAGQVLVTLDTTTEEADLRAAEANVKVMDAELKVAQADRRYAESNVSRLSRAVEARAASEAELDQARSTLDAATARIQRIEAERTQAAARVDQVKSTIAKKTLRAPFRAVAGLRNIHPGQYLAEGSSVVGLQSVSDRIYLDFALPQELAARASKGLTVAAHAPMLGHEPVRIEVVALDATANPTTRNVRVRAVVPNPGMKLRPGMFVDVTAPIGETAEYVVVPQTAVRKASFGDQVYVIAPDEKDPKQLRARQRFVKLGPAIGGDIAVLEGLKPGEEIAADGSFKLREGALVTRGEPSRAPEKLSGADASGAADDRNDATPAPAEQTQAGGR
jgi:membrane fusion protein, multidrug efflux system